MKRFLTLLVLLLSLLDIQAQDMYKISSTSTYNIRTSPSTKSEILGNTTGISSLEVYEIKDGWAKINHSIYNQLLLNVLQVISQKYGHNL